MGVLDGGLAKVFAGAFGGVYLPARLYRAAQTFDAGGSITASFAPQAVKGQLEAATEAMRGEAGYTAEDVAIFILADGVPKPSTNDEVSIKGVRYKIASVATDPAQSYWLLRGTPT